jgi:FkbM family methyltransferase
MKETWFRRSEGNKGWKFGFSRPISFLVQALQNRPRIRKLLNPILKRAPIVFSFQGKALRTFTIDWCRDDEVLELAEQVEASTLLFLQTDLRPDLIFDIGASCGISTHILFAQAPTTKVIAYEPRPNAFVRLQRRIQKMPGSHECHQAAVGLHEEKVNLKDKGVGTSPANPDEESFSARMVTLDEKVIFNKDAKLVLKIDIEGEEKNLLPEIVSQLSGRSVILLETHQPLNEVKNYATSSLRAGFSWSLLRYREMPEFGGPFADWILIGPSVRFEP